jgi:hypothetical protein
VHYFLKYVERAGKSLILDYGYFTLSTLTDSEIMMFVRK